MKKIKIHSNMFIINDLSICFIDSFFILFFNKVTDF